MTNSKTLLALTGLFALAAWGQQSPGRGEMVMSSAFYRPPSQYTFEVDTKLVEVGVVVRDSRGHGVAGLTQDDFEIADEGRKRQITAFSVETSAPPAATPASAVARPAGAAPAVPSSAPATVSQRYVALIFDDLSMEQGQMVPAQAAALRFIKGGLREGDRAGLFTMSGAQNVAFTTDVSKLADAIGKIRSHLRTLGRDDCPGMTPYEAYQIANRVSLETYNVKIQEAARCTSKPPPPDMQSWLQYPLPDTLADLASNVMSLASMRWEEDVLSSRTSLIAIGAVVDLLARMPGSRTVLLASSGFLSGTLGQEMDDIVRRALHAGVVVNALDAKALFTTSLSAEFGGGGRYTPRSLINSELIALLSKEAANDAMAALAYNTGGLFFHNQNDLDAGFRELGIRPEVSYLLGFTPREAPNGQYHHLKVRLKTAGHNSVQARLGYVALKPSASGPRTERRIDTVAVADNVVEELPGALAAHLIQTQTGDCGLMTVFHVDIKRLQFTHQAGERRQKLSLIAMLTDASGNFVTGKEGTVTLALKESTFNALPPAGADFTLTLVAPPGSYRLRAVMAEGVEGKVSARTLPAEIR